MVRRTLRNLTIVLTGASSGIGRATALMLAREGVKLVLAARNQVDLNRVAEECRLNGADAIAVPTDVTDPQAVKQLADQAAKFGGQIDVLVNNAGVGAVGEFNEVPVESHAKVIATNLLGYLFGAHAVLPYFKRREAGTIINVNSEGGFVPAPLAASYSASKFGLRGFAEALRGELERWPGIKVCDVFPGFVDTPGLRHAANYTGHEIKPLPPLIEPETVADAIIDLIRSPRRAVSVGKSAYLVRLIHFFAPQLLSRMMDRGARAYLRRARPTATTSGNLFAESKSNSIDGGWKSDDGHNEHRQDTSITEPAKTSPRVLVGLALVACVGMGLWALREKNS